MRPRWKWGGGGEDVGEPPALELTWTSDSDSVVDGLAIAFEVRSLVATPMSGALTLLLDDGDQLVGGWWLGRLEIEGGASVSGSADLSPIADAIGAMQYSGSMHVAFHSDAGDGISQVSRALYFHPEPGGGLRVYDETALRETYRAGDFAARVPASELHPPELEEPLVVDRVVHGKVLSVREGLEQGDGVAGDTGAFEEEGA